MNINIEILCPNLRFQLGEGPHWDHQDQVLYWVDIINKKAYAMSMKNNTLKEWNFNTYISAIAPCSNNQCIIALQNEIAFFDPQKSKTVFFVAPDNNLKNRSNECRIDPIGRFWHGTMQNNIGPNNEDIPVNQSTGILSCIASDGEFTQYISNIGISNTLLWSLDGTKMFFGDTVKNSLDIYDFDMKTGIPSNKKEFFGPYNRGKMDGSAIDNEGYIWNARFGGSCLIRFNPYGKIDKIIELPVTNPTSCVFGGKDLKTLYITSSMVGVSGNSNNLEGALLSIKTDVPGQLCSRFKI